MCPGNTNYKADDIPSDKSKSIEAMQRDVPGMASMYIWIGVLSECL